jgi:aspartyl-tRNA synthetase
VIRIKGSVSLRPEGTQNNNLSSGQVEVYADDLSILNESLTPPFYINEDSEVDEALRLKYRYLDLRRANMKNALIVRHKVVKHIRDFLDKEDFLEIETPILIKSTPEGARDHIVPSRLYPGKFYALPQSPQQLKQILMVSGVEKYFQIARCFRDEDSRADRQPEFTQLDLEMSFVDQEDVLSLTENLFTTMLETLFPDKSFKKPFPRLTYQEAIRDYGIDRPDLRYGLKMFQVNEIAASIEFKIFQDVLASGGIIKGFVVPGCHDYTRRQIDDLTEFVISHGAKGLISIGLEPSCNVEELDMDHIRSNISRFLTVDDVTGFIEVMGASPGDLIFLIAGDSGSTNSALAALRHKIGDLIGINDDSQLHFAFVTDFPLFEWDKDGSRWTATHHAFCMPHEEHVEHLDTDPSNVLAYSYDLICNGVEIASGSIRVHDRALQERIFGVLGYSRQEVSNRFRHLLDAFEYGAPPHGGIAPGIDRLVMMLLGKGTIRDVIAFPKTQSQMDPLFEAPSEIEPSQLEELRLRSTVSD